PLSTAPGLQMFAKFSPNGNAVAFVRDNNLVAVDIVNQRERTLTQDGSDVIINGTSDWVYEEELNLRDAFRWAPDSRRIAFWRFDQSPEPVHPIMDQASVHARANFMRYPQPGDANAHVRVGVVDIIADHTTWMNLDNDSAYIPTVEWAGNDSLVVQKLNRLQNRIDLLMVSTATGAPRRVLVETDKAWVDVDDHAPYWLAGGKMFLWPSERSGWRRYYLYMRDGTPVRAITPDSADAESVAGIAAKTQTIFISEARPNPLERQVFSYVLTRKPEEVRVTAEPGTHSVDVSPAGHLFVDTWSSAGVPAQSALRDAGTLAVKRVLASNRELRDDLARLTRPPEFFKIPMPDGTLLNAWRMTAPNFDSTKAHPVVIYVYGGPGSQMVVDAFGGRRALWHEMLARKGYVVISVDNRGTGARGSAFEKVTYLRTGYLESQDQIDAAKWIARRPWADSARIALWGWSGGGFMTALTTSRGGNVFHSGIVVAPVIDWRLYDDIYTERYMRTPAENPDGYKATSVLTYAGGLTAHLLLVHGTADDNVHPQNTFWFANALQARTKQFDMMLYPGRTHSISGGSTQVHLFTMMTDFLDRTLAVPAGK
ncbi:MAG TPA: DPP IV N-terminal domain-containing protein, partial [Dongiaceae bacterium]|nr:DPP IV N-terminal domain-containing protein [Dongiaceae bacterium]